jgi:hypothetical protein
MTKLPTIIAHGRLGKDGALIWFLWHPFRRGAWRWPRIEQQGQFGRYCYRFSFGPIDGKYRNHEPERTSLREWQR